MADKMSAAEKITKSRFWRLYYSAVIEQTESVDDVLHSLENIYYRPKGKEIIRQMSDHLFGQYQYFTTYKRHELILAGRLYGGIIERGIIENDEHLRVALQFVLEALKHHHKSGMFGFGLSAVDQLNRCLKNDRVHQYLNYMLEIPSLPKNVYEHLIEKTTREVLTWAEEVSTNIKITRNTGEQPQLKRFQNIENNNERVEKMATKKDGKSVQREIVKILKDLNQFNVHTKCDEIREILTDECLPWFSRYLVKKRIAVEANFHAMYLNLLDGLNNISLNTLIRRETLNNIRILFKQNKSNVPCVKEMYRTPLKNLGHWFGMITIAKNRNTMIDDEFGELDSFFTRSYNSRDRGEFAIPFVVKVLESCADSKVYNTQHPWTIKALMCLAKLYDEPGLNCLIQFQIEQLFRILNVKLEDV